MTSTLQVSRPVQASLLRAAMEIEGAVAEPWLASQALREAALAIEYHLDTLSRELQTCAIEPRLRFRAGRAEERLRLLLVETWTLERKLLSGSADTHRMTRLSGAILAAAGDEIDLVLEQLRDVGAVD